MQTDPEQLQSSITLRPVRVSDIESLREAINSVCAERRYLASVDGFTLHETQCFVERILRESFPQIVAIAAGSVVGWCDIVPFSTGEAMQVGRLGMGLVKAYRGNGIGRRLLQAGLSSARTRGFAKIVLEVFADNEAAIHLYKSAGFVQEGVRLAGRQVDAHYQDVLLMGRLL